MPSNPIQTTKPKRIRGPNKLYSTEAARALYHRFVKLFINNYTLTEGQRIFTDGVEAFFNVSTRRISWCRAKESFNMPGSQWATLSSPFKTIDGTGRRYVKPGSSLVVRVDSELPNRNEIEFDNQVFILTDSQFVVINEKLEVIA